MDAQGEDLLLQIFMSNVLQREAGDKAPFFRFIQRVCLVCVELYRHPGKVNLGFRGFEIPCQLR
jgi:hypothetical protein